MDQRRLLQAAVVANEDVDLVRPVVHVREREPDRGLAAAAVNGRRTVVRADLPAVQVRQREDPDDRVGSVGDEQMELLAQPELDANARRLRPDNYVLSYANSRRTDRHQRPPN